MEQYRIVIQGVGRGLIMNNHQLAPAEVGRRGTSGERDPQAEALTLAYRDQDGRFYVPSENLWRALADAAAAIKVKGRGRLTYKSVFESGTDVEPDTVPLESPGFDPFGKYVRIGQARVFKYRPLFKEWGLTFRLLVTQSLISRQIVEAAVTDAGNIGILDFRPRYGKFQMISLEEVK